MLVKRGPWPYGKRARDRATPLSLSRGRARLSLPAQTYSRESLQAGALALSGRAQVLLSEEGSTFEVEIRPASRAAPDALRRLAGEFLNEALSHEYRQKVIRFHEELSGAALGRLFARCFPAMPQDPLEQLEPQVKIDRDKDTRDLLEAARRMR